MVWLYPQLSAFTVISPGFDDMCTLAPPTGRGWGYMTGTGWDFDAEIAELPELLEAKLTAPSVESIRYATELDRALGYEAAYAGTSFAASDSSAACSTGRRS